MKKSNKFVVLNIISIIIFMAIGINIRASDKGILFDERIMEYVHSSIDPLGIFIMKKITFFGSVYFFLPVGIIILLIMIKRKNSHGIILLLTSTLGSYGLNLLLKNVFIRTRPLKYFLIEQGGYSFPSGHAMISMTFYTTITYLLLKNENKKEIKRLLWIINFIIIGLIGFSRIYLGVHWPTDILMGFLLGLIFSYVSIKLVEN